MESRCKAGVVMASTRSAGGVGLRGDGVQLFGYRGLLVVALLFVTATTLVIKDVHCIVTTAAVAPAPTPSTQETQPNVTFNRYEADALNAVFRNWSKQNPQLSTLLNWSLDQYPCNNLTAVLETTPGFSFPGTWIGVTCTVVLQNPTEILKLYHVSVTSLSILGSNMSCQNGYTSYNQCGFDGIIGQLPLEISNLTDLQELTINHNPSLTGPVPVEFFRMPNLTRLYLENNSLSGTLPSDVDNANCTLQYLDLNNNNFSGNIRVNSEGILFCSSLQYLDLENNSLSGTLPSDIYNANCTLQELYLSHNNFSGNLQVSSNGTLFCSSLQKLYVDFNQLDGPIDFQNWNGTATSYLDFSNNHFQGTFSIGPYFDAQWLDLSCNYFTSISFAKHDGSSYLNGSHIEDLSYLNVSNNNISGPFLEELLQMPNLLILDLSTNNFWGSLDFGSSNVTSRFNVTTRPTYLNVSNNNFNGTFFLGAYFNPSIMDLSNNQFKDIIFDEYNKTPNLYLPLLQEIYFQNNNFSGPFPHEILTASNLQILNASQNEYQTLQLPFLPLENSNLENSNLPQVFLINNKLYEVKYANSGHLSSDNLQISSVLFLGGNPICKKIEDMILSSICRFNQIDYIQPANCGVQLGVINECKIRIWIPEYIKYNNHWFFPKSNTKMKVIIATSTSSIVVLVLLVMAIYVWPLVWPRLMGRIKALHIILEEFDKKEVKPNLYSFREVKLATNNFDKDNKLGEGSFGVVYKGKLLDGSLAAVKKLTMSSNQVLSEFLNEVVVIFGLKHRNLVKLKGCCLGDGDQRILVFEYVENNNLAEALFMHGDLQSNNEPLCLDWKTRFNIIVDIARGLVYLHEELQPPIIHRDIKATNILLDKNYNAKIADFGLAFLFPTLDSEASHLTLTQIAGTRGYCPPKYVVNGHLSTALDVYSFGILILEIVSGRKNIDLQKPSEEIYLREWAWKQYKANASMTLIDQKMEHSLTDFEAILHVLVVALICVDYKATKRPKMLNVLSMLLENMTIDQFQASFEDEDEIAKKIEELPITLDTTSSL